MIGMNIIWIGSYYEGNVDAEGCLVCKETLYWSVSLTHMLIYYGVILII